MFSTNEWYYYIGALDKNTCNQIINVAKGKWRTSRVNIKNDITDEERRIGINGDGGGIPGIDKNLRMCSNGVTNDQWICESVWPWMLEANEVSGWKYDIRAAESMQITRYKKGEFFCFHKDGKSDCLSMYDRPGNEFMHGYVRKLSMTVVLNDDYEGGEFQFATYSKEKCMIQTPEINKTGSIVVFPSDMEHRVTPVTKGIRYSLVVWFLGPPFK